MSRAFMYGTRLQEMEQMMMAVPHFSKRGKGVIIIGRIQYKKENLECQYCSEYRKCKKEDSLCIILPERITANAVSYRSLIRSTFRKAVPNSFITRVNQLFDEKENYLFCDETHKQRFENLIFKRYTNISNAPKKELAILYLLTANEDIYHRMKAAFFWGVVDFEDMNLKNIDSENYALYQAARTISFGKEYIHMDEMVDPTIVDNSIFKLIIMALLITRYGADVLKLRQ